MSPRTTRTANELAVERRRVNEPRTRSFEFGTFIRRPRLSNSDFKVCYTRELKVAKVGINEEMKEEDDEKERIEAVSYTHLTLPTSDLV